MSLLNKAKTSVDTSQIKGGKERDTLGGGGVHNTGIYGFTVDSAYMTEAKSGAIGVVLNLLLDSGDKYSETFYITSGKEKGCNPYYEKNGEKIWLPAYVQLDSFFNLVTGKGIFNQDTEERVVDIYDYESKKTVPTKSEVLVDLLGKKGFVGLHKIRSNKQVKGDKGYVDSPDERFTNSIDKFFNEDKQTATEAEAKVQGNFINEWIKKFDATTIDKYKPVQGAVAGSPTRTAPAANAGIPAAATNNSSDDDDLFKD